METKTNEILKNNVHVFNSDVASNEGYLYTTQASLSSTLANKRIIDATLEMIDAKASTIIDIGAGDGYYTNVLHEARPQLKIAAFDPADVAIKIATKKYPKIEFFVGNILDTATIPDRKFDMGIIRGVLHHTTDPKQAIANSGMLTDRLIIIEPNGNNPILKVIEKVSPYHREHEERSFSSGLLKRWCKETGYEIERIDFVGFVPFFFPTTLTKIIFFCQPFLEKIYPLKKYFGAQIIILCRKKKA